MKTVQDLRSIQSQAILRLNCPGYGQASALYKASAGPLTDYKVIIVNPLSILHLFEEQTDLVKQIDIAISEGLTSFKLSDNELINKISAEVDHRSSEILQFLGQGGLLVYYLCRPFVLIGSSRSLDNYAWMCGLAPDQAGQSTLGEQTIRHMSTVAHGRNIDKTADSENSEFNKYFDQPGLEWNTIIRSEFLTEGYTALATAGPKKCIAGQFLVGDFGGQIVFLPAPYSPDFDRTLIDCIYQWHTNNLAKGSNDSNTLPDIPKPPEAISEPKTPITSATKPLAKTLVEPALNPLADKVSSTAEETNTEPPPKNTKLKQLFAEQSTSVTSSRNQAPSPVREKLPPSPNSNNLKKEEPDKDSPPEKILAELKQSLPITAGVTSQPEPAPPENNNVLPEEEEVSWAADYQLLGIDSLVAETNSVHTQILQLQRQIAAKEETIGFLETVKMPLLSGQGGSFLESCKAIINGVGWAVKPFGLNKNELLLNDNGQSVALVGIYLSKGQAERVELANLAESMINYWNQHTSELKGIFIACPFANTDIASRQEPDFGQTMIEFAKRKNICLLSTLQLLYIYRDIRLGKTDAKSLRQTILTSSGLLTGFTQ